MQSDRAVSALAGAFEEDGYAINSNGLDGLPTAQAKEEMIALLEAEGVGHRSTKYKLRDWLFSRQRYWGEPIPYCARCYGRSPCDRPARAAP